MLAPHPAVAEIAGLVHTEIDVDAARGDWLAERHR
jgi:hypothetical protein